MVISQFDFLSIRQDRLFPNATDFHSLHVALGCLRESLRRLSLQERLRHSLRHNPRCPLSATFPSFGEIICKTRVLS